MVYVVSKNKKPLMPCEPVIARLLLKQGKAKVLRREPFTIKLMIETTEYTQPITLGVDTGSGTIGTAAYASDGRILYLSEVTIRNDIKDKMTRRRKYRRNRRNRKTRYRKARFDNRRNSIRKDRFAPTIVSKLNSHEKEIRYVRSILPITELVLETGTFDPHYMKDPEGRKNGHWKEFYQQGRNYGFANTKAMVLDRDRYTCQCCHGKHKDSRLEVHHIIFRSNGGSDEESNLITLCHTCHKDLHAGKLSLKKKGKKQGRLKHATQMNVIRTQLLKRYPEAIETFGYVTKENREHLGFSKEHYYDACTIASKGKPFRVQSFLYKKRCIPEGDYQQTKGVRSEQRIRTGKIAGFRKFDKVRYFGKDYFIKGRMSSGFAFLMNINGKKIDFSSMPKGHKTPKLTNLKRIGARKSWMVITEAVTVNIA